MRNIIARPTELCKFNKGTLLVLRKTCLIVCLVLLINPSVFASDPSVMPAWMKKMSFEAGPAYIDYSFSYSQLNPGFSLQELKIPNIAFKMALAYKANPYLSARFSYLMPSAWVTYTIADHFTSPATNPVVFTRPVWMNYATLTLAGHIPLNSKMDVFAETGAALVTRKGFANEAGIQTIDDAVYFSPVLGAGMSYVLHPSWSLVASAGWIPSSPDHNQPATRFATLGIRFRPPSTIRPPKKEINMLHPRQWLQVGVSSNIAGYGVNNFISSGLKIFWGGRLEVQDGIQLQYQRNIFHTPRWFAIDAGFHVARWRTVPFTKGTLTEQTTIYTISSYPVLRLNFLQTAPADFYFFYSVAGPGYISRSTVNSIDLGQRFIFTDTMGFGAFAGKNRKLALEMRIGHYSNGNMFPSNPGMKIPLTFLIGSTF